MASHASTLIAQLRADVVSVMACGPDDVIFGAPLREVPRPGANVLMSCERVPKIRSVEENWEIVIRLYSDDRQASEATLLEQAFELVNLLTPYSLTEVPATSMPAYAGVGWMPHAESVVSLQTEEHKAAGVVQVKFGCRTTVYN